MVMSRDKHPSLQNYTIQRFVVVGCSLVAGLAANIGEVSSPSEPAGVVFRMTLIWVATGFIGLLWLTQALVRRGMDDGR